MSSDTALFPGLPDVINGNGAVAYVMKHVCGGVIGYPITPSTEISEIFEAARADGQLNVWAKHPFFVETEGEHSAQSGALGAALTGGNYISNASSSQGILYGLESHYVSVGKKIGGFVLQVAARVVTKHSLNVMAGHDDVYALLPTGYTILFGSNPQEAADLAAISYRASALSLIPVANAMDGFATSHVMSGVRLPEPELLRTYLGDPAGRIPCPTVAQELLFGAKGRVFQLQRYLDRHSDDFHAPDLAALRGWLDARVPKIEADDDGDLLEQTMGRVPARLHAQWRRQWLHAQPKGTRQLVPALVDPHNPGLTGPVQNQPDFQAGSADHRTHFASAVPALVRQAMAEYAELTGREYTPVVAYDCADADYVMVGMGSITDDVRAVLPHLRAQGLKVGVVSVKLLQPFPEAELAAAIGNAKAVTVLERSDDTALTRLVTQALFHARANAEARAAEPYPGVPALASIPRLTTAIFGLGGHDVQPRHLVAAFGNMAKLVPAPLVYLGSQFFTEKPTPAVAAIQDRLRQAYPETELMALATEPNPPVLPPGALRIRFHSVGGYGTVATGKLLTDLLSSLLGMHSKSAPKYGSEKSGAATNYYITLSPEPVLITNAELEDVEVVVAPDHQVFSHTNPLKGLVNGGMLIMQSDQQPLEVWRGLPAYARRAIRERGIRFLVLDAFAIARAHAPNPELETRMMGIAFIGAILGNVEGAAGGGAKAIEAEVRAELNKKFGRRGESVVKANLAAVRDGMRAVTVDYTDAAFEAAEAEAVGAGVRAPLSLAMTPAVTQARISGLFDPEYYEEVVARPFREGTIDEAPVLPGTGLFMPVGTGAGKNKGIFRRTIPVFDPTACTACMECALACPDSAIPNAGHEIGDLLGAAIDAAGLAESERAGWYGLVPEWSAEIHRRFREDSAATDLAVVARSAAAVLPAEQLPSGQLDAVAAAIAAFPVARTRPLFDAPEKQEPGSGALFSAVVDPWKCTGCLQCVEVCGPDALASADQDDLLLAMLETRFERLTKLPDTPERITADATAPGGDIKRILLSRRDYYSMTGGHGACRGCGEVTAIHLLNSLSHRLGDDRRRAHLRELDELLDRLGALLDSLPADSPRRPRVADTIARLERRLFFYESGPTGNGPAPTVIANSTGCSSVYASTMPFSPYLDPWVNGLFQDAQPLAVGIYEGLVSGLVDEVRALRLARLELAGDYDAEALGARLATLSWRDFTAEERALVPVVLTISGDGAAYDIGFGAMSRVLTGGTPIKSLVLDTGGYSNTGGQASTASFAGQDADLARFGGAHPGKQESRKELGLLAVFHPDVFVCATATAFHGHFLRASADLLGYHDGAALMITYTPCDTENGMAEDLANARSRMAVESRVSPLFVHDPRRGTGLAERFSLEGNPDPEGLWVTTTLTHRDDRGRLQLLELPLTPADFAIGEQRFAKQFRWLAAHEEAAAIPIAEYVELAPHERTARIPFVYTTDRKRRLVKMACSATIVALVEDRKRNWRLLQFLAGQSQTALSAQHRAEVEAWTSRYGEAVEARESALDVIAQAMADLATASGAPAGGPLHLGLGFAPMAMPAAEPSAPAATAVAERPIWLDPDDLEKCNDCATCYQELPQLFEKATIVVDGAPRTVGRMRPGALDGLVITPELAARITRVKGTCDAEIIQ